jgi:hypothetical protein
VYTYCWQQYIASVLDRQSEFSPVPSCSHKGFQFPRLTTLCRSVRIRSYPEISIICIHAALNDPLVINNGREVQHCRNQAPCLSYVSFAARHFPRITALIGIFIIIELDWKRKGLVCAPRRREKGILSPMQWIDSFSLLGSRSCVIYLGSLTLDQPQACPQSIWSVIYKRRRTERAFVTVIIDISIQLQSPGALSTCQSRGEEYPQLNTVLTNGQQI